MALLATALGVGVVAPQPVSGGSAGSAERTAACPCVDLLSALVEKVETNYPGYHMEIRGRPAEAEYDRRLEAMRSAAVAVDDAASAGGAGATEPRRVALPA